MLLLVLLPLLLHLLLFHLQRIPVLTQSSKKTILDPFTLDLKSKLRGVDRNWGTDGAPVLLVPPKSHKNVDSESAFLHRAARSQ